MIPTLPHRLKPRSGVRIKLSPEWERIVHFGRGLRRWRCLCIPVNLKIHNSWLNISSKLTLVNFHKQKIVNFSTHQYNHVNFTVSVLKNNIFVNYNTLKYYKALLIHVVKQITHLFQTSVFLFLNFFPPLIKEDIHGTP